MTPVIECQNLHFSFDGHPVLEDVSLTVDAGDYIGIVGPNGGGKTTLLRLILGLLRPTRGTVRVDGADPAAARGAIGYVPQYGNMDPNFPLRVREVAAMGVLTGRSLSPWFHRDDWRRVDEVLDTVHLGGQADRLYGELSGGQRQRCLIARALVSRPKILLLDEPTSSVDHTTETDLYDVLHRLNETITILLVSHDLGFVSSYINKVLCINRLAALHRLDEIDLARVIDNAYHRDMTALHHQCHL